MSTRFESIIVFYAAIFCVVIKQRSTDKDNMDSIEFEFFQASSMTYSFELAAVEKSINTQPYGIFNFHF